MRTATVRATVRSWRDDDGWGVLDSAATPGGCWAHFSSVDMDGHRRLVPGESVELAFESADQDGYEWRAVVIRPNGTAPTNALQQSPGKAYNSRLHITQDLES